MMTNDSKDQGREAFELLPCPFCGNDKNIAMANEKHDHSGGYFIACPDCDASTGLRFACGDDPRALLIEQWNRRAATSASALARDEASVQEPDLWASADTNYCTSDKWVADKLEVPLKPYYASPAASRAATGWKMAMRVLQSDLYRELDDAERAECDALVGQNPYIAATSAATVSDAASVPEGWKLDIGLSDDRIWLTVTTPHGASASLSCAGKHDNGRTIQGQVLLALKEALEARAASSATEPKP